MWSGGREVVFRKLKDYDILKAGRGTISNSSPQKQGTGLLVIVDGWVDKGKVGELLSELGENDGSGYCGLEVNPPPHLESLQIYWNVDTSCAFLH